MPGRVSIVAGLVFCLAGLGAAGAATILAQAPTIDAALQVYGGRWQLVDLTEGPPADGLIIAIDRCDKGLCARAETRKSACGQKIIDFETDNSTVAGQQAVTAALANATEWPIKGTMVWPGGNETYLINGFIEKKGGKTRDLIIWGAQDSRSHHRDRLEARFNYIGPSGCEPATV